MDFPEELPAAGAASTSFAEDLRQERRRTCTNGCGRPINVCLCHTLPSAPFSTATKVVILHHPHERKHKLATVPLLAKCLLNCEIIVGRKLKYGQSKLLDSLHDQACEKSNLSIGRAFYLFPGPNALPFAEVNRGNSSLDDVGRDNLVLIVFDGSWKHAREMVLASLSFLSKFAVQVCLDFDVGVAGGTIFDSELILRKEPYAGCMSTMEAVARCLRILEPNDLLRIWLRLVSTMQRWTCSFIEIEGLCWSCQAGGCLSSMQLPRTSGKLKPHTLLHLHLPYLPSCCSMVMPACHLTVRLFIMCV